MFFSIICFLFFLGAVVVSASGSQEAEVSRIKAELKNVIALYIITVAEERGVDGNLALKVATCESNLHHSAINRNGREVSVGIFQINTKVHNVTIEEAKDPIFNINYAMDLYWRKGKNGEPLRWSPWHNCYNKFKT